MDRNWVKAHCMSKEYEEGVDEFCKHAGRHAKDIRFILCPCQKCLNAIEVNGLTKLKEHLMCEGIDKNYTCWTYHGEKKGERRNLNSNYQFIVGEDTNFMEYIEDSNSSDESDIPNVINEELRDHPDMNERLKDDVALPLWHGCSTKASKLSVVLTLYNLKVGHQISDVFFTEMLTAVSDLLLDGNVLPCRTFEAKQMLKSIGLIQNKKDVGEINPVVSRLDVWEYVRRDANTVVTDPAALQVIEDVVTISEQLGEHELTNIGTDDSLTRVIPLEYSGRVRDVGWGVTKTSLQTVSTGKNACFLYLDPDHRYVGRGILHNDLNDRILHGPQVCADPKIETNRSLLKPRKNLRIFSSHRKSPILLPIPNRERNELPPALEPKKNENMSDAHSQQLALALPSQMPPQPSVPARLMEHHQQQPMPQQPPQNVTPAQGYYLPSVQLSNSPYSMQPSHGQIMPSNSQYQTQPQPAQSQVNQTPQNHSLPQYQQQWSQQIPQRGQQQQHQTSMQPQIRPTAPAVDPDPQYMPSQGATPSPETLPNSMPMPMPYSGMSQPVPSSADVMPYAYGGVSRPAQPQHPPPHQHLKASFGAQPGDVYNASGPHQNLSSGNAYMTYDTKGEATTSKPASFPARWLFSESAT
ncbi:hypothetical protein POM88_004911 [Heracleum sosnowskyi]|uniref:Transposase-associated domain-containing protein n=1 Tax=Heracleum sosnowskyi TaxID=360622 RepID=A0AAD8JKI8_9APIA|nr:hypothetical protein POM88_004911 [Heracleum sosnowskyi]